MRLNSSGMQICLDTPKKVMSAIHQRMYFRVIKYTWIFNSVPLLCSDDGGRAIRAIK